MGGRLAAWALVTLATLGLVLPAVVIIVLQPKSTQKVTTFVNSTAPLDIYVVLDASGSVNDADWKESLLFAKDLTLQLNQSVPEFRAGLGWFATTYRNVFDVTSDLSAVARLPAGVSVKKGTTNTAAALCGNAFEATKLAEAGPKCRGGAYGKLKHAAEVSGGFEAVSGCEEQTSSSMIIMVTDGRPNTGEAHGSDLLPMLAAQFIKAETNTTILGILVGNPQQANREILYGLSSCCAPAAMALGEEGYPRCSEPVNESCAYMFQMKDYNALMRSVGIIEGTLKDELQCEGMEERIFTMADSRSLWFLLLLVPVLVHQLWQRCLLCVGKSSPDARCLTAPDQEMEMTAPAPTQPRPEPEAVQTFERFSPRSNWPAPISILQICPWRG
ncbi:unnamed protein product [Effrenium voratum]|uniref:VWFA domain-containing protein n=1 Tax=Effrenium voratum TaxID=2562239 RepID=A0AA36MLL8_9DINO|nr:unnamed protein product [Effrenium voratum]